MADCLGLRASTRAKQQQRAFGEAPTPAQVLRGHLGGADTASYASSELAAARAAAAAERERCADLISAVEASQAAVRELEQALFAERQSSAELRSVASRSADDVATWHAKYEAAVRAGRTMAALDARPVMTAQAVYGLPEPGHTKLLTDGSFEPQPAPPGSAEADARYLREEAAHREKRAWLTEVQVMEQTIAALRARVDAARASSAASGRAGDETPRMPLDGLPRWAGTALRGQLVHTRARFGADAAEAAESEAAAWLEAALQGLVLEQGGSVRVREGEGEHSALVAVESAEGGDGQEDAVVTRNEALRLVEELRSDWEVDSAQLQAQLQAALERAEKAERIVVAHAMQDHQPGSGRLSTSSFGGRGAQSEAAITVAALQSEVAHLRAALAERCETQAALEEALEQALERQKAQHPPE